jgi:drug/metabolite transporter (DMT)-like permease
MVGYLIVAGSNVLIGGFTGFTFGRGEAFILIATVLWSIENIIAKVALKDTESMIVAWGRMTIGSVLLVIIAVAEGKFALLSRVTPQQWLVTAGSVLLLTGYVSAWYRALALAPATLVASVLIVATPITNVLSAVFITHVFPSPQIVNLAGTLGGLFLIAVFLRFPNRNPRVEPS